ncbi:G-protein coupled receptor 4-like [Lates calcarifer]|uniref:G-protein coupled receptor 4-like n=1 Tax=Lates calcarifer TaxID=8187 RepID=A0AAJ7VJQ8_LATCA|nr:G-protein coupled receptor 4-like [Lates calcarifer]
MEDFYYMNFSQDTSHDNFYHDYNNSATDDSDDYGKIGFVIDVLTCIIIGIGLPLTLVAIHGVYSLVRNDHVAPIYVINLLISDLIQFCCMIVEVAKPEDWKINEAFFSIYYFGLMASVGFMVCVALERYLVIACPLWYRFHRTIKIPIAVCVMVWALPLVFLLPLIYDVDYDILKIIWAVFFILPLPLFIFVLGGTLKALSASRVPSDEKRRIIAVLVVVLITYVLLFLPSIIWGLAEEHSYNDTLIDLSFTFIKFSPLADLFLYVFIRKGAVDKILASLCCCTMESNDISRSTMTE